MEPTRMTNTSMNLSVGLWNCNSLNKQKKTITNLLNTKISILCLNETKLKASSAVEFEHFEIIRKDRNAQGGGVATLVHESIEFERINCFDKFNLELVAIKVKLKHQFIYIINVYIPPRTKQTKNFLTEEFFTQLESYSPYILCGDFNSHSDLWHCSTSNSNGKLLAELILQSNASIINNKTITHRCAKSNSESIIDLTIMSSNLSDKVISYQVIKSGFFMYGHFPVITTLSLPTTRQTRTSSNIIKIKTTNWETFKSAIETKINAIYNADLTPKDAEDSLQSNYELLRKIIIQADNDASSIATRKINQKTVPSHILSIIQARNSVFKILKNLKRTDCFFSETKTKFNQLSKALKAELKAYKESLWTNFCKSLENEHKYSADYWIKIKQISTLSPSKKKHKPIPKLFFNNQVISTDSMKAQVFGQTLQDIFTEDRNIQSQENHTYVDKYLDDNYTSLFRTPDHLSELDNEFKLNEMTECLKSLKAKSAPGNDQIRNKQLINLPEIGVKLLLKIANLSWNNLEVLDDWKVAKVTMIEKKADDRSNPKNYRPISLTNSIIKLIEKLIKVRLDSYLYNNKLISLFQSGFRTKRSTSDNLYYFAEKSTRAYKANKKIRVCGTVFDIAKAFDKVWHNGLIFKLHKLGLPRKMGYWIVNFINNRKFFVRVNNATSNLMHIQTGVMQGAILSPTLFSIYINDILELNAFPNQSINSLLFADDLFSFNLDTNINRLIIKMQRYLNALEEWLTKWKMQIAPQKCSYTIYFGNVPICISSGNKSLQIFSEKIPIDNNPKYLGVTLDRKLNFCKHTKQVKTKCMKLLNILKCLAYKDWTLDPKQQLTVYKTLIRSCMEYAPSLILRTKSNIDNLKAVQYHALRTIFKAPLRTSSTELHKKANLETVETRLNKLNKNYMENCKNSQNDLINLLN